MLERLAAWDREGVLAPFLERNLAEFKARSGNWLSDRRVREARVACGLEATDEPAILELARHVRADETLAFLHFHCERLAFEFMELVDGDRLLRWPSFEPLLPGRSAIFLLLVAMSAAARIRRRHASMGEVPAAVTAATCADVASRVLISKTFNGRLGVSTRCLAWLRHHVSGTLLQFGRLQFHIVIMGGTVRVYRHRGSGERVVVSEPGVRFGADGLPDGAGDRLAADAWHSDWIERDGVVTATAIRPDGRAEHEPFVFAKAAWALALDKTSSVINTHIPRGPRIRLSDWREAIQAGFEHYGRPGAASAPPMACVCRSWMFDPRLQDLLAAPSGLVTLQRRLRLFPLDGPLFDRSGFYFVFGDDRIDPERAPATTTLQKAMLAHIRQGGVLTGGGMLVFPDEVADCLADGPSGPGALAMLGYAKRFRKPRTTREWMQERRAGERT